MAQACTSFGLQENICWSYSRSDGAADRKRRLKLNLLGVPKFFARSPSSGLLLIYLHLLPSWRGGKILIQAEIPPSPDPSSWVSLKSSLSLQSAVCPFAPVAVYLAVGSFWLTNWVQSCFTGHLCIYIFEYVNVRVCVWCTKWYTVSESVCFVVCVR